MRNAREAVTKASDRVAAAQAQALLDRIDAILAGWKALGSDPANLPELTTYLLEDGSIRLEWGAPDYRVGFSIEPGDQESSWYVVSKASLQETGQMGASGYLPAENYDKLIRWLLDFLVAHS